MAEYYLILVVVLFALAIADLVVGVSNDAVNFLNSAIGSRVASRKLIMAVASLGIFLGATFSSGMMEVARRGIFNPDMYLFAEVMIIFLAVMMADIIMLDLFNTFGMPTSTTVSIVFELLGAAFVVALIKVISMGGGLAEVALFINSDKAIAIISAILLSVVIAFTTGVLAQYLSRLLFTFNYERRMKAVGGIWSGFALAAISYFLLVKGLKGASFVTDEFVAWLSANTWPMLIGLFVGWTAIMQVLILRGVNILRFVVLVGTFALAMAFAGNDLVNFIGVAVAGMESFMAWQGSGVSADAFTMEALTQPVRTNTLLLLAAGLIMVLALWFSRKARSVTETEVNLGRQGDGYERFKPNTLSRGVVRGARGLGRLIEYLVPRAVLQRADTSFQVHATPDDDPQVAFDLVRASVNLTIASMLIALATSLKLPLSTTYVSFMVAMGASLADRAWDRDSAVYRVSGVLSVIGGWFLTAFVAFSTAGVFALLLSFFDGYAVAGLLTLVIFSLWRSMRFHKKRQQEQTERQAGAAAATTEQTHLNVETVKAETANQVSDAFDTVGTALHEAFQGLFTEDLEPLRRATQQVERLQRYTDGLGFNLHRYTSRISETDLSASHHYTEVYDKLQDLTQVSRSLVQYAYQHVRNSHLPLLPEQQNAFEPLLAMYQDHLRAVQASLRQSNGSASSLHPLVARTDEVLDAQLDGIRADRYSPTNSRLVINVLLELKDLAEAISDLGRLFQTPTPLLVE